MKNYKKIESNRYNKRSEYLLDVFLRGELSIQVGLDAIDPIYRNPYLFYHESIKKYCFHDKKLLDVCCGDGLHSFVGVFCGAKVTVSDIAPKSVDLVIEKAKLMNLEISGVAADAENLPFLDNSFDIITCAGSLSYVDKYIFISRVHRILNSDGVFIAVDSFNYNPFYKFNRFLHYLRGERTWNVNMQIPNYETIKLLKRYFGDVEIYFFDIFIFIAPLLKIFFAEKKVANIIKILDIKFGFLRKYAFKIVIIAHK